jgi:multiple sugar transport system permease protein
MTIQKPEFRPLQVAMQEFFGQAPIQWGDIMAFASMITVPVLIVFLMFQKWFIQSVASSGVKGQVIDWGRRGRQAFAPYFVLYFVP